MKEIKYPIEADNVIIEDSKTGTELKGVWIRPTIIGDIKYGRTPIYRFSNAFYVMSRQATEQGHLEVVIQRSSLSRIIAGDPVTLRGSFDTRINPEVTIFRPLKNVRDSRLK